MVLYDTAVGRGAAIGPLSLLMKGETLTAGSRWQGIPTEHVPTEHVLAAAQEVRPGSGPCGEPRGLVGGG